jgi:dsRNA-specific ribonuclease
MPAHAFSQNRDVYTKLLAEAMVAFMGALYLDQGDEAARQFFTERVLRYGR